LFSSLKVAVIPTVQFVGKSNSNYLEHMQHNNVTTYGKLEVDGKPVEKLPVCARTHTQTGGQVENIMPPAAAVA